MSPQWNLLRLFVRTTGRAAWTALEALPEAKIPTRRRRCVIMVSDTSPARHLNRPVHTQCTNGSPIAMGPTYWENETTPEAKTDDQSHQQGVTANGITAPSAIPDRWLGDAVLGRSPGSRVNSCGQPSLDLCPSGLQRPPPCRSQLRVQPQFRPPYWARPYCVPF